MSLAFTCASCQVVFSTSGEQRDHYRSEWHRYNLRRKVAELPPLAEVVYDQRMSSLRSSNHSKQEREKQLYQPRECLPCKKVFASEKALDSHLRSRKHHDVLSKYPDRHLEQVVRVLEKTSLGDTLVSPVFSLSKDAPMAEIQDALETHLQKTRSLGLDDCIFCSTRSADFAANMEHMMQAHSLYIPDLEYVVSLQSLIAYLGEKVSIGFTCLYCPPTIQPFQSLHSVRKHMQDRGHCKIRFDDSGFSELSDFYDYTQSYPIMDDDSDPDFEDVPTDEEGAVFGSEDGPAITPDGAELVLPDGRSVGHRAYRHLYKQNLQPYINDRQPRGREREVADRLLKEYRESGIIAHIPTRKSRYDQKAYYDGRKEQDLYIGCKNNGLQKHFRLQLLQ